MIKNFCLFIALLTVMPVNGQETEKHSVKQENNFLTASFFSRNRQELRDLLPERSIAIVFSAPVKNRSNDIDYRFHQDPNFYYLTGIVEPNSVLLIFKSSFEISGKNADEFLFIPMASNDQKRWTGAVTSREEAKKNSGIQNVYYSDAFDALNLEASLFDKVLYLSLPAGIINDKNESSDLYDLVESFKKKFSYPPSNGDSYLLGKHLRKLREIKKPEEISVMRKAISISIDGHVEMMKTLRPGMTEYQAQATGEFVFKSLGAEDTGYPSICGGGGNSCVLHYEKNRDTLKDGDLLLLDMGAEFQGYTADITRTLPVNGTFSNEQRIIYNLVLKARDSAFEKCMQGNGFNDPHYAAVRVIKEGLLELGIISDENQYSDYFMHGTSHYLGLDAHDAGTLGKLSAGNIITIEPGIYISSGSPCDQKWWSIGIRIEDDILITKDGYENLSSDCPSRPEEVEKTMKLDPVFFREK